MNFLKFIFFGILIIFNTSCSKNVEKESLIKEKNLDINSLKNDRGNLDLNDGDGFSYKSFKSGNYDDNKYLLEVYIYYISKLVTGAKGNSTYYNDLSEESKKELLIYFIDNYDKATILLWESKEWTYSKILIENIDLWEYLVNKEKLVESKVEKKEIENKRPIGGYPTDKFKYYSELSKAVILKENKKDYYGAIADINYWLEFNPKDDGAYNLRGTVKLRLNDYYGALADFNKALEYNPKSTIALSNKATVKEILKD